MEDMIRRLDMSKECMEIAEILERMSKECEREGDFTNAIIFAVEQKKYLQRANDLINKINN